MRYPMLQFVCLALAPLASSQDCTPDQTIAGTPIRIYSCQGTQEVEHNGIDQVFDHSAGVVIVLDGNSWGFTAGATGGSTGSMGDWTFNSSVAVAGGYQDHLSFVPPGAGGGEQFDVYQTVTYVDGDDFFSINWRVENNTSVGFTDVRLIHGADAYVNGDDAEDMGEEYFVSAPVSNTVGLRDLTPSDLFQGFSAILMTGDPSVSQVEYFTSGYSAVWNQIRTMALPNTVDPAPFDQGVALAFYKSAPLAAGEVWTVEYLWVFDFPQILFDPLITTPCLHCAQVGTAYSKTLKAISGLGPYTWSVVAGTLPPGLSLNPATGEISGTLTLAGMYAFTARVTDSSAPPKTDDMAYVFDGTCAPVCATSLCGDCDGNGRMDILDPLFAAQYAVGLTTFKSAVEFANCNVYGAQPPSLGVEVGVGDALTLAQSVVGTRVLQCCPGNKIERNLSCGEAYCGIFVLGDPAGTSLTDFATNHYFSLPSPPASRGYQIGLSGAGGGGDLDLYAGAPGTMLGDTNIANYPYSSTNTGSSELITIDEGTMPYAAQDYAGGELAFAVQSLIADSYSLTVDCVCAPIDITGPGTYVGDTSDGLDAQDGSCNGGVSGPELVFTYTTTQIVDLVISTDNAGTGIDTVLYVTNTGCAPPISELACDDDGGTGLTSAITLPLAAADTYTIFVDTKGAGGAIELTVTEVVPMGCGGNVEGVLPGAGPFPIVTMGDSTGADNTMDASCTTDAADHVYEFTPMATGDYQIDTCGSAFDTVLQVRENECVIGADIACNDDATGVCSPQSVVMAFLTAGTTYYISVDAFGAGGVGGAYTLRINPVDICTDTVDADLTGMALPISYGADTTGADDSFVAGCGAAAAGPDHIVRFIPPATDAYDVNTCGSSFDTILEILEGDCAGGARIGCNDDGGSCGPQSELASVVLQSGVVYWIRVSGAGGASGAYTLNITESVGCGLTVEGVIPAGPYPQVVAASSAGADDTLTIGCGGGGGEDHVYEFTPAASGDYRISTCGSTLDTAIEVRETECIFGTVAGCNDDGSCAPQSELDLTLTAGITYFIIVDAPGGVGGSYTLNVDVVEICTATVDADLSGFSIPFRYLDTTAGADSSVVPACGAAGGPDHVLRFTPMASGVYTLDTCGSAFDTVLEIVRGDCVGGTSLGCNDNSGGCSPASEVTGVAMNVGEVYFIRISGAGGASGAYQLNVNP